MKEREYPRTMVDETIVGGPFVRYVPDLGTMFMVIEKVEEVIVTDRLPGADG